MNASKAARFWPPWVMPNSDACLIELIVSAPALASPMILAFEACACSRKEEKSVPGKGGRTFPSTLPHLSWTVGALSGGGGGRMEWGAVRKTHVPPPVLTIAFPVPLASAQVS